MKSNLTLSISFFVFLLFVFVCNLKAQPSIPPDTTMYWSANYLGVKTPWTRGPDSTMVKGQLVIRFHQNALDYNKLIQPYINYYYGTSAHGGKGNHIQSWPDFPHSDTDYRGFPDSLQKILKLQRFYFDSSTNIVLNSSLKSFLHSAGGYYLRRLTTASPVDTLTLTHRGDTIACDHYNWMVLSFDTTVNSLLLSYYLTMTYPRDIDFAVPDRKGLIPLRHPGDNIKFYDTCEIDLKQMINAEKAWNYEVGNPNIVLALFDFGVDYRHPDLGGGFGPGKHVKYGMQFSVNSNHTIDPINTNQGHGTPTAGIMSALTNRNATSVAGVAGGWGVLPSDSAGAVDQGMGCSLAIIAASQGNKSDYVAGVFEAASHSVVTDYGIGVDAINTSWIVKEDGFQEPDLHGAINYAFESGVVQCAAMADKNRDESLKPGSFPADYEEPWVICVSGSEPDKSLEYPHVAYGYSLDLLAPAGNPLDGCGGGLSMNWTTINSTAPPNEIDSPNFNYGSFGGTSASAPHVTGAAGLILSWFSNSGHKDTPKLTPEDVGGILKASAWRNDTDRINNNINSRTWRKKTGWGHLDIGKTFEMLDPNPDDATDSRYVLRHYSFTDNFNYGDWLTQDSVEYVFDVPCSPFIHKDSTTFLKYQNREYILNGVGGNGHQQDVYYARVRPVTRLVTLDSIWEVDTANTPLFAWGRSGSIKEKSGWNFSTYNNQTGWSFVMDGMGGDSLNEGIFHSQSTTFTILTAQYDVWAWDTTTSGYTKHLGHVPADSMMGVNFSVYGRLQRAISGVKQPPGGNPAMMVSVNPAGDLVMAHLFADYEIDHATVAIYDMLGRLQASRYEGNINAGDNTITYPVNQLSSGTYILRLSGRGFTQSKSFHIIR
jgi:subtilisin family serine protease